MSTGEKLTLAGFRFEEILFHQEGSMLITSLGGDQNSDGAITIVGLLAGRSYTPKASQGRARLYILAGTGTLSVGSERKPYHLDEAFEIVPGVMHGFVEVMEPTVFISVNWSASAPGA